MINNYVLVIKVSDLKPDSDGVNLHVKVFSQEVVLEKTRSDGTKIRVAEALVGDETGCLTLTARNSSFLINFLFIIQNEYYH